MLAGAPERARSHLRTSAMGCWSGIRRRFGLGRLRYVMIASSFAGICRRRLKLLTCKVPTTQDTE